MQSISTNVTIVPPIRLPEPYPPITPTPYSHPQYLDPKTGIVKDGIIA